jgi:hypothetical protein
MAEELKKWDYRVQAFGSTWSSAKPEDVEAALIEWGMEGWEVVGTIHKSSNETMVIAKRPLTHAVLRERTMPSNE